MIKDSKGKKISSEELNEIYNNKQLEDFGNYLTYNGDDSQILEVVRRINFRRSPKLDLNYTRSYIDYLQKEAFKLAGDRKFARVVRMTFDPYFSAKDIQRNLQMSLREFLYDYSLSDMNNSDYAMWKGFEDKEFNDKVERFAKAYKIKIPESKNDMKEEFKKGGKVTWKKNIGEDGWSSTMESQSAYDNLGGYISESGNWKIFRDGRWYVRQDDGHKNFKRDGNWIVQGKNEYGLIEDIYGEFETLKEAKDYVQNWVNINPQDFNKGGSLNSKLFSDYDFDEDGNPLGKTIASEIFLNKDKYKSLENKNLILSSNREYNFDREQSKDNKPRGLWYAKGFEWIDLLIENIGGIFPLAKYTRLYEIEVTDKVLKLIDEKDAIQFTKEYGVKTDFDKEYFDEIYSEIDWKKVATNYSGIELSTQLALNSHYTKRKRILEWTSGWDIGSGCIWDKSGIDKITLIMEEGNMEFKKGGKVTWRNKYNKKYGFDKDESHSLKDISKKSGVSMKGLQQIYNKGIGAYKTNPSSVRPNVTSKEQWAMARVYSSVMGGKASKVDAKELKMVKGGNVSSISYEDWKKAYINLNNEVDEKSLILEPYDFRDEKVRMSEEYQKVKKDFDKSFKKLQDFNKVSPKQYQKRYHNEKRASWRMAKGGKSRTRQDVIDEINKLNEQSRSGKIPYAKYYRAYEKLRKEAEAIKRYNSFPQQMKRFGASVKKAYGRGSYYYIGKHIDAEIYAVDTSMGERWEITTITDEKRLGSKPRLQNVIKAEFEDNYYQYETKKEATMALYNIDSGIDEGRIDKNMQSEFNYAKGGYITEGDKQSDYATLSNEDKFKYIKKEIGSINGLPIKLVYEEWDRTSDEEYVVQLDDPKGIHEITIEFDLKRNEDDNPISIERITFRRSIMSNKTNEFVYWASAKYGDDYDFNRAFEDLKEKGEYIFNTIEDFEKFMRIIQLDRIVYALGYDLPLPIKKKLVVTKDTSYYDLPNFKNIMKQIKKRFSKVWRSNIDEKFATRNDKDKMDYKPYILNTEIIEGKSLSDIKENEDFDNNVRINLYYREQKEPKYLGSSFSVSGSATYLANGQFYNLKIDISDSSWYQEKRKKYLIKDYSTDQKELIAFLRKELKKTKKLK